MSDTKLRGSRVRRTLPVAPPPLLSPSPPAREVVAVVSHSHPSISKGGAETSAYTLFQGLLQLGVEAVFIAACPEQARARLMLDTPRERAVFYDGRLYDHTFHLAAPDVMRGLVEAVEQSGATVVNFHHYINFGINTLKFVASSTAARSFLTLHEFLAICQHHGQMITRQSGILCERASLLDCGTCFPEMSFQQIALRRALALDSLLAMDGFITPSHFLGRRYTEWGLPAERIKVVENGLMNLHSHAHAPFPLASRPCVFGFFGQINPFKGVDMLLDAAELLSQRPGLKELVRLKVHGNIVGQPEEFVARFAAAREKHDFLTFSGPYNNGTVGQLMAECDYILVPSTWWENSPVVIQEAYGAGRPVICAGIGGMAEKVPHGVAGLNFRPGDTADLVRVIQSALVPETFDTLLRSLPKPYDAKTMASHYMEVFRGPPVTADAPAPGRTQASGLPLVS